MNTPHVCLLNCIHPADDVRVVQKVGRAMRESGIRVTWVGPGSGDRTVGEYGIEYHFFPPAKGRIERLVRNHRAAFQLAKRLDRADVYIGVEPDSAAVAVRLARVKRARAIFDVHEAYNDEMLERWAPRAVRPLAAYFVTRSLTRLCAQSDLVIGVNDAVLSPYRRAPTRQLVIRSCAPASFADGPPADVCAATRRTFTLMHGKATVAHGTAAVVEALGLAAKRTQGIRGIFFDVFDSVPTGFTREKFQELVRQAGAEDAVDLRTRVHMREMPDILRSCDLGLITYDRTWGVKSLPNKLFEYMALGLPIVAPTYSREIRPIIEAERCGLLVDCERPREIADALVYLRAHPEEARAMGQRAREAFVSRHNFQSEVRPLVDAVRGWADNGAVTRSSLHMQ